ncbi:hypothetical protein D3C86_2141020 [compost metagenome]
MAVVSLYAFMGCRAPFADYLVVRTGENTGAVGRVYRVVYLRMHVFVAGDFRAGGHRPFSGEGVV